MNNKTISSELIRGHLDTILLSVLSVGDNYGYEIIKAIARKSREDYLLKEPSLYTSLKRLETHKLIESYWGDESQGGRRKYYRITASGRQMYEDNLAAWKTARVLIDRLVEREGENK